MKQLVKIIMGAMAVMVTEALLPGIQVDGFITGMLVALVLSLLNVLVKPLLILLTIPLTLFSMGLFLLVINAVIILLAGELVPGFQVNGFWPAFWFSLLFSIVQAMLEALNRRLEAREQQG